MTEERPSGPTDQSRVLPCAPQAAGDVRVAGKYTISDTGGLEFRIFADHTSPAALDELPQQIHKTIARALFPPGPIYEHTRTVNLTIPFPPLADHEDDVTLGFLTAAYLLWFRALGYSP